MVLLLLIMLVSCLLLSLVLHVHDVCSIIVFFCCCLICFCFWPFGCIVLWHVDLFVVDRVRVVLGFALFVVDRVRFVLPFATLKQANHNQ